MLRSPSGTHDVLPPASGRWEAVGRQFSEVVEAAGYGLAVMPTFEDAAVFHRVGASTDVVRHQMYDFEDKGGRPLALRPEMTASVARSFVEHRPTLPWKVWYEGSSFRYERPQAGRQREFHQLGVEALGSEDPDLDAEVVTLAWDFLASLGLGEVELLLNSLGDSTCRPAYRALLLDYLRAHRDELCEEHQARLEENPLRVLDCKRPSCQEVTAGAPRQLDHLCEPCANHFARVRAGLDAAGVPYRVDTSLVRGLDYYTRTAFEYKGLALDAAQDALGGGGRYDGLVEEMGGPGTPGIGFALGVERILLAMEAAGSEFAAVAPWTPEVFVVDFAGGEQARDLCARLRRAGVKTGRAFDGRSPRAQMRAADRSGARFALVIGPDEAAAGKVGLKDLTERGEEQVAVDGQEVVAELLHRLERGGAT